MIASSGAPVVGGLVSYEKETISFLRDNFVKNRGHLAPKRNDTRQTGHDWNGASAVRKLS